MGYIDRLLYKSVTIFCNNLGFASTSFVSSSTYENIYPICCRAVRYHPKFAYRDTIALVSRYTSGIDTLHDMAYMT